MNDPDDDDYGHDDSLERRFYDEAQQALKDDAESYNLWLDELIREGLEYLTDSVEKTYE